MLNFALHKSFCTLPWFHTLRWIYTLSWVLKFVCYLLDTLGSLNKFAIRIISKEFQLVLRRIVCCLGEISKHFQSVQGHFHLIFNHWGLTSVKTRWDQDTMLQGSHSTLDCQVILALFGSYQGISFRGFEQPFGILLSHPSFSPLLLSLPLILARF